MFIGVGMYSSYMDRLGMASGAGAFHRHLFYSSSEHLEHPPPYLTHAVAAFMNSNGGLEDGDMGQAIVAEAMGGGCVLGQELAAGDGSVTGHGLAVAKAR